MTKNQAKSASHYAGMTVNERLFDSNLLTDFDRATIARDRARMISVLEEVFVENPEHTVDAILYDPKRYGY